jgi:hypothetical protein
MHPCSLVAVREKMSKQDGLEEIMSLGSYQNKTSSFRKLLSLLL